MTNRLLKNRVHQTVVWTAVALAMLAFRQFRIETDWLGIATLATLLTAGVHALSLAWFRRRSSGIEDGIVRTGSVLASLYGHDDQA